MELSNNFTTGKILSPLLKFAFPVLLALLLQSLYGAVDLIIVSKFARTADISAVATGSQILHCITGVLAGLTTGITVLLGQRIGEGKAKEAGKTIGAGICLFALVAVLLTALLVALSAPIATVMNAPEAAFSQTVRYVRICSWGTVFIIAFNVLGGIFRGLGDSKIPLITVAIACVVNIAGDLLLVAVLDMGAAGAAIATVFAQAVSVALSLLIIRRRSLPFSFGRKDIRFDGGIIGKILQLGLPICLQQFLVSVSFLVITSIVNSLGLTQSAGMGVAEKICAFIMLIPSAYMQSMSAFVAQNMGAGKPERAKKALLYGILTSLAAGVITGWLSFFHGDLLAGIFANAKEDPAVIAAAADYLKAYAVDCIFVAFLFCFIGYFSGLGKTVFVMLQGIIGAFAVRVPVSWLVSRIPGVSLFYIGLATPASTIVQIILCFICFFVINKKDKKFAPSLGSAL